MKRIGAIQTDSDHFTSGLANERTDRNLIKEDNYWRINDHVNKHNRNTKITLIFIGAVLLILTGILYKPQVIGTIPFKEVSTPATTGTVELLHRNLSNTPVSEAFEVTNVFANEAVEVESWMLNLEGWLGNETIAEEAFFAEAPFIALQPWMVDADEWLNPGYFEEMITVEPWMISMDAWSSHSTLWEEEFIEPEEWMTDIALWSSSEFSGFSAADFNEEIVNLEPWMLNVEGWLKSNLADDTAISTYFEEVDIEVKPWMMSLDEWNSHLRTNADNIKDAVWF